MEVRREGESELWLCSPLAPHPAPLPLPLHCPTQIMSQLAQRDKLLPLLEAGTERAREERTKALARRRAEAAAAAGAKA